MSRGKLEMFMWDGDPRVIVTSHDGKNATVIRPRTVQESLDIVREFMGICDGSGAEKAQGEALFDHEPQGRTEKDMEDWLARNPPSESEALIHERIDRCEVLLDEVRTEMAAMRRKSVRFSDDMVKEARDGLDRIMEYHNNKKARNGKGVLSGKGENAVHCARIIVDAQLI